jgi:hypothetical protein
MIASLRGEVTVVSVTADDCRVENNEWLGRSDYFLFLVVVGIVAAGAQDPDRHPHLRECRNQESHVSRGWVGSFLVRQRTTIIVSHANTLPAPGNPSIETDADFCQFGELLHSGNNPANLCWPVRSLAVKVLPGIGSTVDCSNRGLARFANALGSY